MAERRDPLTETAQPPVPELIVPVGNAEAFWRGLPLPEEPKWPREETP